MGEGSRKYSPTYDHKSVDNHVDFQLPLDGLRFTNKSALNNCKSPREVEHYSLIEFDLIHEIHICM